MKLFDLRNPIEKEWEKLCEKESKYAGKKALKEQSRLDLFLEEKIPDGLQNTLDKAFCKAFNLVFSKGAGIIEKTYNSENIEDKYIINSTIANKKRPRRKALKALDKTAGKMATGNLAVSAVSGVGLGIIGVGIPDIMLFVSLVLKSLYQISLSYGWDYKSDSEKKFILLVIQGALTFGEEHKDVNEQIDFYIENGFFKTDTDMESAISSCAKTMSGELLYMKFLQGIPVVGAIGGAYDAVYMKQINDYAKLKYYKRFLIEKR